MCRECGIDHIVNRRLDDECQRACGVYRSVDEGQQAGDKNSGDWDLVICG